MVKCNNRAHIERLLADRDALREQLDAARQALKKIGDGTWNVGTGKNLTAREYARAVLAAATPDTPPKDSGGAQQARAVREQEA